MKSMRENINEMKNLVSKMPKTINEAMDYDDEMPMDYEESMPQVEEPVEEIPAAPVAPVEEAPVCGRELINDFRKKALKAMAELADTPEDPNYEILKRIWQLCDKATCEKPEEKVVNAD